MHPTFAELAAVAATLCGGAGVALTPRILRSVRRRQAVHDRLLGKQAVTDKNGTEIAPKVQSIHEEIELLRQDLLARPALNGKFDQLVKDVAVMKVWTVNHKDLHDRAAQQ